MAISEEWQGIKYQETLEEEARAIDRRMRHDPDCKIEDLQAILKNLYILEGANHDGRGSLQDIILAARISAYEQFITSYKTNSPSG